MAHEQSSSDQSGSNPQPGGVKSMEDRIRHLEADVAGVVEGDQWVERLKIHGLVEIEAGYSRIDFDDPDAGDEKSSDVDLATVELAVDARIAPHVDAHVLFKYEADDLFVDQGYISLTGPDRFPAYLIAGRQVIPFGWFESHFITDPTTLELGETNEGAVVIGYRPGGEWVDISAGAFNGKTEEAGADDHIADFVGRIVVAPLEGIRFGASYTSNLAAADSLADQVLTDLNDTVAGWSVFTTVTLLERLTVIGEYLAALDAFEVGELYTGGDTERRRPAAWNVELGYALSDRWQAALRYGGATDGDAGGAEFLPETQYGAVVNWGLLDNTNLAMEYLHGEFENDVQKTDVITAQLAVEF
jgi:hypothetical protein